MQELYETINNGSVKEFELIVILDCCYSGGFTNLGKYGNIDKTTVITSYRLKRVQKVLL